jgi:hypothetical protein
VPRHWFRLRLLVRPLVVGFALGFWQSLHHRNQRLPPAGRDGAFTPPDAST